MKALKRLRELWHRGIVPYLPFVRMTQRLRMVDDLDVWMGEMQVQLDRIETKLDEA